MKKKRKRSHKSKGKSGLKVFIGISIVVLSVYATIHIWQQGEFSILRAQTPEPFTYSGIDVSHHQGVMDWELLLKNNPEQIDFVYLKITEGKDLADRQFANNHQQLRQANIPIGAYHFLSGMSTASEQTTQFLTQYKNQSFDLPPVLDVELQHLSKTQLIHLVQEWIQQVEWSTHERVLIYCPLKLYRDILRDAFPDHKFWIAAYSSTPTEINDNQILMWQYREDGKLEGCRERIDFNYAKPGLLD